MREKITNTVFALIFVAFFVLVMIMPKDEAASVQENRELAKMPEISFNNIFFGSFESDYETFLTDNVGFRSKLVNIGTAIENAEGLKSDVKIVKLSAGQLLLRDGKIMEVFKENPDARKKYISALDDIADVFSKDSNMYLMLAPTQIEFDQTKYHRLSDSEKGTIDAIYDGLSSYKTVNVYDALKSNIDKYIYFRTDHHWTQRGAYLGYCELCKASGIEPIAESEFDVKKLGGFLGYLYNQANDEDYKQYADDIEYFERGENYTVNAFDKDENGEMIEYSSKIYTIPAEGTEVKYSMFMGGDHPLLVVDTDIKNGKTALIIKDSYANAVMPLLTQNYSRIIAIDPRSFYGTLTELREEYDIDDVFVINYVFTTTFTDYIENLTRIV